MIDNMQMFQTSLNRLQEQRELQAKQSKDIEVADAALFTYKANPTPANYRRWRQALAKIDTTR